MKNREIKFRVWDKFTGSFEDGVEESFDNRYEIYSTPRGNLKEALDEIVESDNYVIQQFTGLLDKNGKEIYEGDIMFDPKFQSYWEIYWKKEILGYDLRLVKAEKMDCRVWTVDLDVLREEMELVGNIFENKELIS